MKPAGVGGVVVGGVVPVGPKLTSSTLIQLLALALETMLTGTGSVVTLAVTEIWVQVPPLAGMLARTSAPPQLRSAM